MTTRSTLTGSQARREQEILNNWLVFSPMTHEEYAISGVLYTTPIGQDFKPEVVISSGSYETTTENGEKFFVINKDVHLFEQAQDAADFVNQVGTNNITTIKKIDVEGKRWIEIQLVNYNKLNFDFEIEDFDERKGFRIEIEKSSSFGYEPINREAVIKNDTLVSDTYLKYFDIEVDK